MTDQGFGDDTHSFDPLTLSGPCPHLFEKVHEPGVVGGSSIDKTTQGTLLLLDLVPVPSLQTKSSVLETVEETYEFLFVEEFRHAPPSLANFSSSAGIST
jgi:hypothetical protein